MKARDYLNQVRKLDRLIENKLIEKEQWKLIATGTTANVGGERVQSSGSKQKMADAVCRYISIEDEIDEAVDVFVNKKMDVIQNIEKLDVAEYDVLHKIYIQYKSIADVSEEIDKTYSWVTTVHGRGLRNLQTILDNK